MTQEDKLILIGVISGAHGIKGDLIVKTFISIPNSIGNLKIIDKNLTPISLQYIRDYSKGGIVCKMNSCNTRNSAEALAKTALYCLKSDLPQAKEEEFYYEDLVGLQVYGTDQALIGTVTAVYNYGAGDIIEIKFLATDKKELFPFTKEYFPLVKEDSLVFNPNP